MCYLSWIIVIRFKHVVGIALNSGAAFLGLGGGIRLAFEDFFDGLSAV